MLKNFLTIALRNLGRNKAQTTINIAGLALGIACCLMIFLVVRHELSYDSFHTKADRIYRVNSIMLPGKYWATGAPMPMAMALKQDFPEIEQATTTAFFDKTVVKVGEQVYQENGLTYVAPEYFSIMDAKWLAGNPQKALSEPNAVVLTKSLAQKYFGGSDQNIGQTALGKVIKLNTQYNLKVTGVLEDVPANTDFPFQILVSFASLKIHAPGWDLTNWGSFSDMATHLVLLRPGTDPKALESKFPAFDKKNAGAEEAAKRTNMLQPLRAVHYDERFKNHNGRIMAKENIAGLILIGVFILLTACINFINLATAQSVKRSKEVGVRKVLGADRKQLMRQFLSETSVLSFISTILAIGLSFLLAPQLKSLLNLQFTFNPFTDISLSLFILAILVTVSLLAGVYPAFILSGYKPVLALKNKVMAQGSSALVLRRSLIVLQFGIAQLLIICTIVVSSQLEFFRSKPLGFNKEAIITVPFPPENKPATARALRNQLEQIPGVQSVSFAITPPSSQLQSWSPFFIEGDPKEHASMRIPIDHNYLKTYGLSLILGENLDVTTDSSNILVNESFLYWLNIPVTEAVIGKKVKREDKTFRIAGVVKDFQTGSLHKGINAVIMEKIPQVQLAGIKIEPANMRETVASIEELWKRTYPESVFQFEFLDETIAGFYREEVKMFKLFRIFAGIAIFISCLGLYGLVSFMAVQRTKEIGIRKVLGASMANIVTLFTKEFFLLILIAFALAAPLAWYTMRNWLQNFENQITMGPGSFVLAILFSLIIAGITVVYRSAKAAMTNPVKNLRSE